MPIRIADGLPAKQELLREGIQVMEEQTAQRQDIRPLKILLLNLMPKKEETELQFLRLLGSQPLQIEVDFLQMSSRKSSHTNASHLEKFYYQFNQIQDRYYDGLIVTGAPVEHLDFEGVTYWQELQRIFDWSKSHVFSCLHICWGAQAGLYLRYGVEKYQMDSKLSGIYPQDTLKEGHLLFRGFDDSYVSPHSRHTEISKEEVLNKTNLEILSEGPQVGVSILASRDLREIYSFGHLEYDRDTLAKEYFRDRDAGLDPHIPENYFKDDDVNQAPCLCWSSSAALFFSNWVNYAVYQETPFDWRKIEDDASAYGYL